MKAPLHSTDAASRPVCVAPRSHMPSLFPRRALLAGRGFSHDGSRCDAKLSPRTAEEGKPAHNNNRSGGVSMRSNTPDLGIR